MRKVFVTETLPLVITWRFKLGDLIVYTIEKAESSDLHLTLIHHIHVIASLSYMFTLCNFYLTGLQGDEL